MNAKERLEAWRFFNEWEEAQPVPEIAFDEILARMSQIVGLAECDEPIVTESIEEKVDRLARARTILSCIRPR